MDTVILAAGKGERLDGITAPYHKPLLVVNGRPIVQQAVDLAQRVEQSRAIVVVAPDNAAPISHVLGNRYVHMIVQRTPRGPGLALSLGLELARPGKVLVLMGDNISTYSDIASVAHASPYGIGTQLVYREEAIRFTYWRHGEESWVEKIRPAQPDLDPGSGMALAWVGPLTIDRDTALEHYSHGGVSIGPVLDRLVPQGTSHTTVSVSTYDIGVPEALA